MKEIIFMVFLFIGSLCASQNIINLPDYLIEENDTIHIQSFPLLKHPKIDFYKHFYEKGIMPYFGSLKNYHAEWRIIDNKLYLSNIYSINYHEDNYKADLKSLFGDKFKNNHVLADWYNEKFYIPNGDFIVLGQSPGRIFYETEIELTFNNGIITRKQIFNNNYFKSIYTENEDEILQFIQKHINLKKHIKSDDELTRIKITIETGNSKNDFTVNIDGNINDKLKNEIIGILNKLPHFDYYRSKGKDFITSFNFNITFKN